MTWSITKTCRRTRNGVTAYFACRCLSPCLFFSLLIHLAHPKISAFSPSLDRISIQYPSGSLMNATPFMLPPSGVFLNSTSRDSKRAQAAYTSGTETPMWPKPRGSELPSW